MEEKLSVLITGGNAGIGYNIAKNLSKEGHTVNIVDIETENIEKLSEEYGNVFGYKCDLREEEEINAAVEKIILKDKKIDVLFNNACICIFNSIENKAVEEIKEEFDVNYFGYLRMIKAVLPYMMKEGKGIIHNMSSGVGITGFPGISGYSSTKGAIEALTKSLSLEFRKTDIYINVMHPPLTRTKSSGPLGVPLQMMEDPEKVGEKLAGKIMSTKKIVCPDIKTRISIFFTMHFPYSLGKLLSVMTEKVDKK